MSTAKISANGFGLGAGEKKISTMLKCSDFQREVKIKRAFAKTIKSPEGATEKFANACTDVRWRH